MSCFAKKDEDLTGTMFGSPNADGHKTELQLLSEKGCPYSRNACKFFGVRNAAAVVCLRDITNHIDMQELSKKQ